MDSKIQKIFAQLDEWDKNMQTVPEMGISPKFEREQYDNIYTRNKYKDKIFDGKKTCNDYLTGKKLHKNAKMAKNKYGKKAATQHVMDIDHITPIAVVHDLVKDIPFITKDDVKTALNREWNLRGTPANINRSKGAKTNFEMSVESLKNGEIEKGAKQIADGTISAAGISTELTIRAGINAGEFAVKKSYKTARNIPLIIQEGTSIGSSIENTGEILRKGTGLAIDGASDALAGAEIYIGMEAVRNLYLMAEGKITAEEAANHMGKMAANVARTGATERVVAESLKSIATNTKNDLLKNVLKSNKTAEFCVLSIMIASSVLQSVFSHETIDAEQIFSDLFHDTIGSFSGILQTAAILLPVPGLSVAVATSLLVTAVCSTVYSIGQVVFNSGQGMVRRLEKVSRLEHQALAEMSYQRNILKMIVKDEFENWDITVDNSFEQIMTGMMKNNVDGISVAINDILSLVGKSVRFKSKKDFDDFFMKDNLEFTF